MGLFSHITLVCSVHFLFSGFVGSSSRFMLCKHGFFYENAEERCKRCSDCPDNQIIHTPCSNISDVKCEPFNIPSFRSSNLGKDGLSVHSYHDLDEINTLYGDLSPGKDGDVEDEDVSALLEKTQSGSNHGPATVEKEDKEYWKKLALALIGVLSVLIVVATVIVIVAWAKFHKSSIEKLPEDGDTDDADSGYVVIRSIRHITFPRSNAAAGAECPQDNEAHPPLLLSESTNDSSRSATPSIQQPPLGSGSLCYLPKVYKPQRRLLNYDADDVFESDDNPGCCTNSKVKSSPVHPQIRN